MKTTALGTVFVGMWLVTSGHPANTQHSPYGHEAEAVYTVSVSPVSPTESVPSRAVTPPTLTEVVQQYCVVCHNDALMTGNVSLQDFSVEKATERAETAEKMIRKLRAGMMPPPGMPRPSGDTLLALVETLESTIEEAALAAPNLGERRFQRLSQAEYERVIRDVLALEVDAGEWLPPDVLLGSFDNMSDAQPFSTTLLDSYLRAATDVSRLAVGNREAISSVTKYRNPEEVSQHAWDRLDGTPFGTRGGMVVTHDFPADGEYVFQVETAQGDRMVEEDVDISIDGEPVALIMLEHSTGGAGQVVPAKNTEAILVPAGQHEVSAAFVNRIDGSYDDQFSPPKWSSAGRVGGQYGVTGLAHLTELLITGPRNVTGVSETDSRRKIFTCHPTAAAEERPCAESILAKLATQAYRRPVTEENMADLINFYDEASAKGGFETGVRMGVQAILISPEFLFRLERMPDGVRPGHVYRMSDVDLATRLSFFLWASAPDEELLEVAAGGGLSDPTILEQQVERMLADPRSETLATSFAHQWLRLQDVGKVWPERFLYPDFSQQLAEAMVRETELLFQYLVQEDRSLLEFFDADYTFLNERLAGHYQIDGVSGDEFRRVQYPHDRRRGILGHGSVLLLTSMSIRTSPVLRGKWVMEVLMGAPPPPPPPNVPAFEASPDAGGGRRLTTRERMEAHSAAPVCNSCHRFMDPIGLALDNFDVVGQWRIRENMAALDTRGVFYDGSPITMPSELTQVLLKRPIPLVRNFTEQLLSYAIGRPVEYFDQPTIRAIARAAEANDYKTSSFIMGIVKSDVFQMKQTQPTAN
jgi:hypothetical protein